MKKCRLLVFTESGTNFYLSWYFISLIKSPHNNLDPYFMQSKSYITSVLECVGLYGWVDYKHIS